MRPAVAGYRRRSGFGKHAELQRAKVTSIRLPGLLAGSHTEFGGVAGSQESRQEARYPTISRPPSATAACKLLAVQRGPLILDCGWAPGIHLLVLRPVGLLGAANEYRRCLLCGLRYFPVTYSLTWVEEESRLSRVAIFAKVSGVAAI